jgi:cholesterol transport system auxiliary component
MNCCRSAFVFLTVAMTGGCSGLLHSDAAPDQTYVLRAAPAPQGFAPPLKAPSLRIGRTLTAPGLEVDRVMLVRSDHRMDYFAASRWASPVPDMVEDLTAETLRNSGAWSSVHDSRGAFSADYYLQLDIRRFEADYTEGTEPKVHIVLGCSLGRRTERQLLANFTAEGSASATANRMSDVVAAFESATQKALATVAERSKQALSAIASE